MEVDESTFLLFNSVLSKPNTRQLFSTIVKSRIADKSSMNPDSVSELDALKQADLIGVGDEGKKVYVTAKGLKVARDLGSLLLS